MSEQRISVDRIEGDLAVLVDESTEIVIPTAWLPDGAGEGSWLKVSLRLDPEAQESAEERVRALQMHFKKPG